MGKLSIESAMNFEIFENLGKSLFLSGTAPSFFPDVAHEECGSKLQQFKTNWLTCAYLNEANAHLLSKSEGAEITLKTMQILNWPLNSLSFFFLLVFL